MLGQFVLGADRVGHVIERAVGASVLVHRLEQVVVPLGIEVVVGHLTVVTGLGQDPIQQPGGSSLADDVGHGGDADEDLAALVMGGVVDSVGGDFGLVDRWHRHGLLG